jgi:TRAP-type transport system periplasmic protein
MNLFERVLCAILLTMAVGPVLAQTRWDLPAAYPTSNFHTQNLQQFATEVERASGGKLKITVHANAALFKAPEIKRAVQGGQAQAGEILLSNFANEWPIFGVDALPFLAESYDASMRLYQAQRPALEQRLARQGMLLLYAVPWPPQAVVAKQPINTAAELKGVKWRAYNPATARMAELLGAQPVTVQAAELAQAMATGVVEAYMSSAATSYETRTYEHIKYYIDVQAWLPKNAVLVNRAAFDALAPALQAALLKAAAAAEARGWELSRTKNLEYQQLLKSNGMTILPPTARLKQDLQRVGKVMLEEWLQKAGTDGRALIAAYRKTS